tara:strand:+ start:169 stop:834 length:666 start_codon:yes stop_codon:yes gene_type:complete
MVVPLAISLAPILKKFPVKSIRIDTEQSISGAGRGALERFREGVIPGPEIIGEPESVVSELRRILEIHEGSESHNIDIEITAECERVHREFGHSARVEVELSKNFSAHELIEAWSHFQSTAGSLDLPSINQKSLIFVSDINQTISSINYSDMESSEEIMQRLMNVYVGEVNLSEGKLCFKVASDNTVRGAAGNSILLAETMLAQGIIHDSENPLRSSQNIR